MAADRDDAPYGSAAIPGRTVGLSSPLVGGGPYRPSAEHGPDESFPDSVGPPAAPAPPEPQPDPAQDDPLGPQTHPEAQPVEPQRQPLTQSLLPAQPAREVQRQPPIEALDAPAPPTIAPMAPPPGWYGDIYGNSPRWWDGATWTDHILIPFRNAELPPAEEPELNFFDNAVISFSFAPDWVKFLTAAVVAAAIALAAIAFIGDGSTEGDAPDGFVPQTPELEEGALPGGGETPGPTPGAEGSIPR